MHSGVEQSTPRVEVSLVTAHGLAALVTLLASLAFGIVAAIELLLPDLFGGVSWLSWGRIRYAHTQGVMLGWLGNVFFAFLYHAVPILSGRRVTSAALGRWLFAIWNFAVMVPGWILVLAGVSQPLEWAEFPLVIDAFVVAALVLAAVQFLPPFFRKGVESLYVSSWYIIGGLVFTLLAYPMGNFVPEIVPGARGAAFSGLWIHDAVGLFVTPLALAIIYFVIPAATGRPIYSHFLSMLGFWLLFFLYPLNGTHHYVFSVIPMEAQISAIVASTLLGVDVVIVVTNLLLSLRGSGFIPARPRAALRGHRHGVLSDREHSGRRRRRRWRSTRPCTSPTGWSGTRTWRCSASRRSPAPAGWSTPGSGCPASRYNARAFDWAYWLLVVGVTMMVVDLTMAGLVRGADCGSRGRRGSNRCAPRDPTG